jgi:hypothetical protein
MWLGLTGGREMNRDEAKRLLDLMPIIRAFVEGKTIQEFHVGLPSRNEQGWFDTLDPAWNRGIFRIKPESPKPRKPREWLACPEFSALFAFDNSKFHWFADEIKNGVIIKVREVID